jgi:hypothetical protein
MSQGETIVNMVMGLRVPKQEKNFVTTSETFSFSRRTLLHEAVVNRALEYKL